MKSEINISDSPWIMQRPKNTWAQNYNFIQIFVYNYLHRAGYIIFRARYKMEMWGFLFKKLQRSFFPLPSHYLFQPDMVFSWVLLNVVIPWTWGNGCWLSQTASTLPQASEQGGCTHAHSSPFPMQVPAPEPTSKAEEAQMLGKGWGAGAGEPSWKGREVGGGRTVWEPRLQAKPLVHAQLSHQTSHKTQI